MHLSGCDVQSLFALVWCKQVVKAQKCMRKVLSFFHVFSASLSVSQAHMYKYRHLSPDPPLTHLPRLFLGTPENIISAKQTAASSSASSHDLCPFTSFWRTTNFNRSTLRTTDVMSKQTKTNIHYLPEKLCQTVLNCSCGFSGGLGKYSLYIYNYFAYFIKYKLIFLQDSIYLIKYTKQ